MLVCGLHTHRRFASQSEVVLCVENNYVYSMELRSKAVATLRHSVPAQNIYEVDVLSKYTMKTMV